MDVETCGASVHILVCREGVLGLGNADRVVLQANLLDADELSLGCLAVGDGGGSVDVLGDLLNLGLDVIGAIIVEIILTFVFVFTVLGVTKKAENGAVAGIVIGLTLAFVHIIGIPLTGTSVNPARSLAPALFLGGQALQQVWVFILAPILGAVLAGLLYKGLVSEDA